ncbi:MAG: D-glycero-beta-D-manno-heptose 1,7-bisphosphate 7-phosphatase [Gammaproteobacteria bacterium]|nr:D-glycero-beta-D-manno-heptose 1,7-bisphosphate 7-phosphatase [Gammaproteobacteria bacterium]
MKLIILDRDGVINQDSDNFIKSPEEFIPLTGSLEAITRLHHAGYLIAVATNQSGIARGLYDIETLNLMHEKLHRMLQALGGRIDAIFFCPHGPEDNCECRKPKPGMLNDIQARFNVDLNDVSVVGDSLRDLQAAQAVGAKPVLVRTGKGERTIEKNEGLVGIPIYDDLASYVDELLQG